MLPAVRALCSRSAARLRYLSYSAPKPQAPRKRRCASPPAHWNGGSAGAATPNPKSSQDCEEKGKGGREGEGKEGRRRRKEKRQRARGEREPGRKGGKEEERGEGKEGAGSERPTAQGFDECDKYIESL